MQSPELGERLPIKMNDDRWPHEEGWMKMQQTIRSGGEEGPINVHYSDAVDDFKIDIRGEKPKNPK